MKLYKREKYLKKIRDFYHEEDIIKVITGIRRSGKSSLMETIVEELQETGIPQENLIYIDLDKRGYKNIKTPEQLEKVIDEKSAGSKKGIIYLFIDEIQNVASFEEVLNGFRTDGGYSIFITGSNSYLLSGELITKLTGRYLEFELFTLTFDEYIDMKRFYKNEISPNLHDELVNYIIEGGFPRTITLKTLAAKRTYVQGIISEIFKKDIQARVKIRKKDSFESVQNFIINNFGAITDIKSIQKGLKQNGKSISYATIGRYIQILSDAKIIYECPRFDLKSKRAMVNEKKYYLADLGIYYSTNTDNRINYGPNLENMIYLYARSQGYSISVGRIGKLECDFIMRSPENDYSYVQVAYVLANIDVENREYRPLEQIKDNYPKYVITTDSLLQKRNGIKHVNLMRFCLNHEQF